MIIEEEDLPPVTEEELSNLQQPEYDHYRVAGGRRYVKTGRRSPGRPPLEAAARMQGISAVVPATQAAWLRAQPGGISTTIRNAVAKAMQAEQDKLTREQVAAAMAAIPVPTPAEPQGDFD